MKKIIAIAFLMSLVATPFMISAIGPVAQVTSGGTVGGGKSIVPDPNSGLAGDIGQSVPEVSNISVTLNTIATYFIGALIVVAVFYIIWAGYTFVTSAGDPDKVGEARKRIMFAGIGVIVALMAKGIVSLVLKAIG
jgi:hypothetical protein